MKSDLDFARVTNDWLAQGPSSMPDRALRRALDEIHKTQQMRFGAVRRATGLGTNVLRFTAAAAIAFAVVGATLLVASELNRSPSPGPLPPSHGIVAPSPTATTMPPFSPDPSLAPVGYPGSGTIVFSRNVPALGGQATWLINPDGSGEAPLNVPQAQDQGGPFPVPQISGTGCCSVFSPDGRQVAIGYDLTNPWWGDTGTWTSTEVLGLDGSDITALPRLCGACSSASSVNFVPRAWSPDGKLIAVELWNDAELTHDGINLAQTCMVNCEHEGSICNGSGCDWRIQVTGEHRDVPIAFSPDGKRLLFIRLTHDDQGVLMVMTLEGRGGIQPLSPDGTLVFADGYFGPAASWSPDGSKVAFAATDASGDTAHMSAYVVGAFGESPTTIAGPTKYLTSARWSPDGNLIAFDREPEAGPGGFHDLYIVHPDGSGVVNLTDDFTPSICCARWSPDSQALLGAGTLRPDDQNYLYILPIDGSAAYRVTTTPAFYSDYSWGPASR